MMQELIQYVSACGSLKYAKVAMRSDIAHAVAVSSRFMAILGNSLVSHPVNHEILEGDKKLMSMLGNGSDMADDVDTHRSTRKYVFALAVTVVSWCSRLQRIVALPTPVGEHISAIDASKEATWLICLCNEIDLPERIWSLGCETVQCQTKNTMFHVCSKQMCITI